MKACDEPAGMTDAELKAAEAHHKTLALSYSRAAFRADSKGAAAINSRMADTHKAAERACRAEIERRKAL